MADPDMKVVDIEDRPLISIPATAGREEVLEAFRKYDRVALPVTDADGHMLGIITVDDVRRSPRNQATEEIQKLGGMEALDAPYLEVGFSRWSKSAAAGWPPSSSAKPSPPPPWAISKRNRASRRRRPLRPAHHQSAAIPARRRPA